MNFLNIYVGVTGVAILSIISGCSVAQGGAHKFAKEYFADGNCSRALGKIQDARNYGDTSPQMESDFKQIEYKCSDEYKKHQQASKQKYMKQQAIRQAEKEKKFDKLIVERKAKAGQAPKNYIKSIKLDMRETLLDSRSVIDFSVTKPVYTKCRKYNDRVYGWVYGWLVVAKYNSKNNFGGYNGLNEHSYFFQGEKIINKRAAYSCSPAHP